MSFAVRSLLAGASPADHCIRTFSFAHSKTAVRHAPDAPEYLLRLGNAYRAVDSIDFAAHAFGELTQRFRDTPYKALGWYKLARLFQDHSGLPEERADAHQSFAAAYECLQRLSQLLPHHRDEGPWSTLGQVEEGTLFGLALFGEELRHLPRLFPSEVSGVDGPLGAVADGSTPPWTHSDSPPWVDRQDVAPDNGGIALSDASPGLRPPLTPRTSLPAGTSPMQFAHRTHGDSQPPPLRAYSTRPRDRRKVG